MGRDCMYACIASATRLPLATACTTVLAPWATSPAAKTPGREVCPSSSTEMMPLRSLSSPLVVLRMLLPSSWLTATMTPVQG